MLERLEKVLISDLKVEPSVSRLYLDAIIGFAQLAPQLTRLRTGILPLDDVEDAYVLETAIAARADILITANFKDFISTDSRIVVPERQHGSGICSLNRSISSRHLFYFSPAHQVHIVHPYLMMDWLNAGAIPHL